ncbi:FAD-dependent oxidoreductase [Megasphaera vaginalis (ex Bordigoni et al. 2020)]|uniref:FAD-dependent oxidoreductase n=1 Tax=Megasphaera vaginalis (ex Bordigoni et al. 2020) TaxID=2045301 RepID=UPI000C7BFC38|nr:FAD-dependent oxidoreductase [Megasphaera vaginalis (ex Bordigoni et al. 2020)]
MMYNTLIIGFGKAGKTLAGKLAAKGEKVALIEKSSHMYGGTCINIGCIPSKTLSVAAAAAPHGDFSEKAAYYRAAVKRKNNLTAALRKANYDKLIAAGVEVIDGIASFADANRLTVKKSDGSTVTLSAEKIIINTGAGPFIPPIKGIKDNAFVYVSETIMDLDVLPEKLTIIGGGYIGLEFASMFAEYGSEVTILQDADVFLGREDSDMAQAILAVLTGQGIRVETGVNVTEINDGTTLYEKGGQMHTLAGDAVLVATGRRVDTTELQLSKAGIRTDDSGMIVVDDHLRTTAPSVWAAGDVCNKLQFTYMSLDDSRIIWDDIYGQKVRTVDNRGAFAYSVFINPTFSRVGLSEAEAKRQGLAYTVVSMPAAAIPKAKVLGQGDGLLKALVDPETDLILGAQLFCADSHELINIIRLAMTQNIKYTVIRDFIFTHPTLAEGLNDFFALV